MGLAGEQLTYREVTTLAHDAGWREANLIIAVAITTPESQRYTRAEGPPNPDGSWDRGVWQLNSKHFETGGALAGKFTFEQMFDPALNAQAAYIIFKRSRGFRPWAAYQNKLHEPYLAAAITGLTYFWRFYFDIH